MSDMAFRKIRPSVGESSTSISNPISTSESTGSDPRRGRGERDSENPKRRKVPESITRNACLNCKKARAKVFAVYPIACCRVRVEFVAGVVVFRLNLLTNTELIVRWQNTLQKVCNARRGSRMCLRNPYQTCEGGVGQAD